MKTLSFKTNIHCSNCIRAVSGFLDEVPGIEEWKVDTEDPDKILTLSGRMAPQDVVEAVLDAGFDISPLPTESTPKT